MGRMNNLRGNPNVKDLPRLCLARSLRKQDA